MDISNKKQKKEFHEEEIQKRVAELGKMITEDYAEKKLMVIPLLKGGFVFAADLIRCIPLKMAIEFITTSSYGDSFESSKEVKIVTELNRDISEFDVLIVDDIVDSGITLKAILEYIKNKSPKSVKTCTLLDKPSRRLVDISPDYCGYEVEDVFIVGYGLNFGDYYRNTPFIFSVEVED